MSSLLQRQFNQVAILAMLTLGSCSVSSDLQQPHHEQETTEQNDQREAMIWEDTVGGEDGINVARHNSDTRNNTTLYISAGKNDPVSIQEAQEVQELFTNPVDISVRNTEYDRETVVFGFKDGMDFSFGGKSRIELDDLKCNANEIDKSFGEDRTLNVSRKQLTLDCD